MSDLLLLSAIGVLIIIELSRRRRFLEKLRSLSQKRQSGVSETGLLFAWWRAEEKLLGLYDRTIRGFERKLSVYQTIGLEYEQVFQSLREAIVILSGRGRIVRMNEACASLHGSPVERTIGRDYREVLRNAELVRVVERALHEEGDHEEEIIWYGESTRYFRVYIKSLRAQQGEPFFLLVLNDVSYLRRLETIRKDFVANVSHELRTPITSIKASAETLQEGALREPEAAERFLKVISRQADRLAAVIEDLLTLSGLEQDRFEVTLEKAPTNVSEVIQEAIDTVSLKASEQSIRVEVRNGEGIEMQANSNLLRQAIVNLLDNAIKYSHFGGVVYVESTESPAEVKIHVRDEGAGIAEEHLPRLFERFYRVDTGRSRSLGGTGLGLAIVKHIAQVHGGSVVVNSSYGKGSTFSLVFPRG